MRRVTRCRGAGHEVPRGGSACRYRWPGLVAGGPTGPADPGPGMRNGVRVWGGPGTRMRAGTVTGGRLACGDGRQCRAADSCAPLPCDCLLMAGDSDTPRVVQAGPQDRRRRPRGGRVSPAPPPPRAPRPPVACPPRPRAPQPAPARRALARYRHPSLCLSVSESSSAGIRVFVCWYPSFRLLVSESSTAAIRVFVCWYPSLCGHRGWLAAETDTTEAGAGEGDKAAGCRGS